MAEEHFDFQVTGGAAFECCQAFRDSFAELAQVDERQRRVRPVAGIAGAERGCTSVAMRRRRPISLQFQYDLLLEPML